MIMLVVVDGYPVSGLGEEDQRIQRSPLFPTETMRKINILERYDQKPITSLLINFNFISYLL